jgi:hypothetical protein
VLAGATDRPERPLDVADVVERVEDRKTSMPFSADFSTNRSTTVSS